jgi:predicted nucleic acid-binding Zn ribbon protein
MKYTLVLIFIAILFLVPTQAKTFEEDIANEVSAPAIFPEAKQICQFCIYGVQTIVNFLNESEDYIIEEANKECNKITQETPRRICLTMVSLFGRQLIRYVKEFGGQNPREVCQRFTLCPRVEDIKREEKQMCTLCVMAVSQIQRMINESEAEIIETLKKGCLLLPEEYRGMCSLIVVQNAKELIEFVKRSIGTPQSLCQRIGACQTESKNRIKVLSRAFQGAEPKQACTLCVMAISQIQRMINESEEEIIKTLLQQCAYLPEQYQQYCRLVVNMYAKDLIAYVRQFIGEPREACQALGVCRTDSKKVLTKAFEGAEPKAACTVCVLAISQIQRMINESEEEIIKTLLQQCAYLPEQYQQYCRLVVNMYAKDLIAYVRQFIGEPREACQALGVCRTDSKKVLTKAFEGAEPKQACTICVLAISQIQRMINESEEEIVRTLLQQCSYLPEQYQQYCRLVVNMYAKDLIAYVRQFIGEPREACQALGVCRTETMVEAFKKAEPKAACTICVMAVSQIQRMINENEDEIIKNLLDQCVHLPESYRNFCRMAVSQFGRELIKYVKETIGEPNALCKKIGACRTSLEEVFKNSEPKQACTVCVLAISQIQRMINESEEEIVRTLLQQCAYLPEQYQQYCRLVVNMYAKDLIQYVRQFIGEPREACQALGVCRTDSKKVLTKAFEGAEPKQACTICVLAISQIQRMINESEEEIIKTLLQQCSYLPEQYQQYCRLVVNMYAKDLIQYVRGFIGEPREACQALGVCRAVVKVEEEKGPFCELCKFAVDFIDRIINQTEEEIIRELIKECNKLEEPQDRICRTIVEVIGRDIIKFIKTYGGTPIEVCRRFRLCPTKAVVQLPEVPKQICQFCIYGVQTIVNYLNESEDYIINEAVKECNKLTQETPRRICLTMVSLFGRPLIRYVKEYGAENPREVCKTFRLCSAKETVLPKYIEQVQPKALCTACVLAVSQIQRMINESEEEIIRTLLQQCAYLPEQYQQYCRLAVNMYAKDLIGFVRTQIGEPREACQALGVCRTKKSMRFSKKQCIKSCLKNSSKRNFKVCKHKRCFKKHVSKCIKRCHH